MKKFFKFGGSLSSKLPAKRQSISSITSSGWGSIEGISHQLDNYAVDFNSDRSLTKLHKACWMGNSVKLKKHLKSTDVNQFDAKKRTPLHLAASRGNKEIASVLLSSGAKVNLTDIDGYTPLLKAIQCFHSEVVELLLENGADLRCADAWGNNGLHLAAKSGQQDVAFALIQRGVNVNSQNDDGNTPVMLATLHKQSEMVELILRHQALLNITNKNFMFVFNPTSDY